MKGSQRLVRDGALARLIGTVRDEHMSDIWPHGSVPTIATYGAFADATWSAFDAIDRYLELALERPSPPYAPVSAFVASYSTRFNVYVAARYWLKADGRTGIKDLFTFSTGPDVEALVHSGQTPELVRNPYSSHINNLDLDLRRGHHFDAPAAAASTELPHGLRDAMIIAIDEILARKQDV
ncbi:MAG TPA: hypothetical protein VGR87_03985 [Candidatus Limnocylindria bacterium]|jgi:hypothetical protein|nr:hypothetical protein [Candidatus Limnocylindria bacterium]